MSGAVEWAEVWAQLTQAHSRTQRELGAIDSAICEMEEEVLVRPYNTGHEREAALKQTTASLRSSRARLNAEVWALKAQLDMIGEFYRSGLPYLATLDPTQNP